MESVLMPSEIELFIDTMTPQTMKQLGSDQWLNWHNRLQKLNQEAVVEAACIKDEHVKETLVSFRKAPILVHEAILVNIWKYQVLPKLLKLEPAPKSTFIAYSILYHEGVCISLLELVMYHSSCCEALGDSAVDLLDYACGVVSQLLSNKPQKKPTRNEESAQQELTRQRDVLTFSTGIRCLSILRYLAENLDKLPMAVCSRMYTTHDLPVLLTEVLLERPWVSSDHSQQYVADKWKDWDGEQLGQVEAQVWLTLHYMLLGPECARHYPITKSRRNQLVRLLPMVTPSLLDQMVPLMELKQWLCRMSFMEEFASPPKLFLLESVLEIKENILRECGGKWKKIAEKQLSQIFTDDNETLKEAAKKLNEAYNTDLLEQFESKDGGPCAQCGNGAIQRCSQCKGTWYCSRACQVAHWPDHKRCCQVH
ncbi:zinc finger MYND domain-containing protein 10-like [Euwallacea fornicatus]|uniref:zinc finger MYND domain-containing protein 10-like n=1 Tax=Euwallacea fornicatus TaxID=995702 RepID=UPI00338DE2C3